MAWSTRCWKPARRLPAQRAMSTGSRREKAVYLLSKLPGLSTAPKATYSERLFARRIGARGTQKLITFAGAAMMVAIRRI
jgi:hypothetical protein